jgi:hypothetical protein
VSEGAYVFITGRREPELAAAVKEIGKNVTGGQGDEWRVGQNFALGAKLSDGVAKIDGIEALTPCARVTE